MTFQLALNYIKTKSKSSINISKHVHFVKAYREKCEIMRISNILKSKRVITPTKIEGM